MISYCIACLRPLYAKRLIEDLIRKTRCKYEILLWMNVVNADLTHFVLEKTLAGAPIRVLGVTPQNVGMFAYRELFQAARYDIITQIDDDVIRISPGIAEQAWLMFQRLPKLQQIVADVWQDEWTTGSRPAMSEYRLVSEAYQLYHGRIDGWFSMYRREMLPTLLKVPYKKYEFVGSWAQHLLAEQGLYGLLCTRFKVLHLAGPAYAELFGQLDKEIAKYAEVGRDDIVESYRLARGCLPPRAVLQAALERACAEIDRFGTGAAAPRDG